MRGDTRGPALPTALLGMMAGAVVLLLVVTAVVLRPWGTARELMPGSPPLWLRLRGNMLGSRCELEARGEPFERIPFACGTYASLPEWGTGGVVRTLDLQGRTCVVERRPLRAVACIEERAEWMWARPDYVALGVYDAGTTVVVEIDRTTGVMNRFTLPPHAYLEAVAPGDPTLWAPQEDGSTRALRLERGGVVEIAP